MLRGRRGGAAGKGPFLKSFKQVARRFKISSVAFTFNFVTRIKKRSSNSCQSGQKRKYFQFLSWYIELFHYAIYWGWRGRTRIEISQWSQILVETRLRMHSDDIIRKRLLYIFRPFLDWSVEFNILWINNDWLWQDC